jgi:methionyl-tRNA formyltransferase
MGTPDFAVPALLSLHEKGHEIVLVVTQRDKNKGRGKLISEPSVKIAAKKLKLKIFQPDCINDLESLEVIQLLEPDYIVVVAYGQILKQELIRIPKKYCLNIHASLLPKYRGAAPINWSIINGEKETGISIMKIEKGLDSGPILFQDRMNINESITAGELHDKLMSLGAQSIVKAIELINDNKENFEDQNHDLASYAPMLNKKMSQINWEKGAKEIHNRIRGLDPWPGSLILYKNILVKIFNTSYEHASHDFYPGTIVKADEHGILISCIDGFIRILEIQLPGKKRMTVKNFLLGNEIEIGYRIGDD